MVDFALLIKVLNCALGSSAKSEMLRTTTSKFPFAMAYAHVVERLFLAVDGEQNVGDPRPLHHHHFVLHGGNELIALTGRAATKLGIELPALQARADGGGFYEVRFVAVEVGPVWAE